MEENRILLSVKVPIEGMILMSAAAKSLQLCPTLRDPMDCSLPGSSAHEIFQARVLEWGAIAFSELSPGTAKKNRSQKLKAFSPSSLSLIHRCPNSDPNNGLKYHYLIEI